MNTLKGRLSPGLLVVSAEDKGTGSKEKITITNDQNLLTHEDEDEDEDKQC
jgi:molecular chaperone DnaK (HSP70)